ncbi:hypothetical protein LguiA_033930 [Lonicera macranthoides]
MGYRCLILNDGNDHLSIMTSSRLYRHFDDTMQSRGQANYSAMTLHNAVNQLSFT